MSGMPIMQLRDNCVVLYSEQVFSKRYANNRAARVRMTTARQGQYSGKMTGGTRKRLCKAITLMCQVAKPKWVLNEHTGQYQWHRLTFVTLTVSDSRNMTAKEGYAKLLAPFLQWMRREQGVKLYVWKAELQHRGQLHYHITSPTFIPWQEIRAEWNRLQRNAGTLDKFADKHGHADPNSADAHEVHQVRNLASYVAKELAKSMQNETATEGKLWDCSDNLSKAKYFSVVLSSSHDKVLDQLKAQGQIREVVGDFFAIMYFTDASPPDLLLNANEKQRFNEHMDGILRIGVEQEKEIPVEFIRAADVMQSYTPSQVKLFLN